jgi:hypothetical protein
MKTLYVILIFILTIIEATLTFRNGAKTDVFKWILGISLLYHILK